VYFPGERRSEGGVKRGTVKGKKSKLTLFRNEEQVITALEYSKENRRVNEEQNMSFDIC